MAEIRPDAECLVEGPLDAPDLYMHPELPLDAPLGASQKAVTLRCGSEVSQPTFSRQQRSLISF